VKFTTNAEVQAIGTCGESNVVRYSPQTKQVEYDPEIALCHRKILVLELKKKKVTLSPALPPLKFIPKKSKSRPDYWKAHPP